MDLRNYINNLEISKKINLSQSGRRFENGDFARSVETYIVGEKRILHGDTIDKIGGVIGLATPYLVIPMVYGVVKGCGIKKHPLYREIKNDSSLTLNH